ncbi:MAG: ABC transporter substrate-binding protein [Oscillospiraceae bacterium]|jgi:peptide/nickel transport system substrate-binding protein|nr:ABC transporter substrate-binding protein [Oscillospiraceae bacterium]
MTGKMNRKPFALMLCLALVCTLFAGMSLAAAESEPRTITLYGTEWEGTDLFHISGWYTSQGLVQDTFFTQGAEDVTEILPMICSDFSYSDDGLTLRLTFPEGMKFADGSDVGPEDFKASIEYGLEDQDGDGEPDSDWGYAYTNIIDIQVDGRDAVCTLSEFRADLEYFLVQPFIGLIPSEQIESLSRDELLWKALPYGQYYMDEYVPGSHVTLKPNPYYYTLNPLVENKGVGKLDYITVKFTETESFTLTQMLKEGDLDLIYEIDMEMYRELEGDPNIAVKETTYPSLEFIEFNKDSRGLDEYNVRKAIALTLNRDEFVFMCDGLAIAEYAMAMPTMLSFNQRHYDWVKENLSNDIEQAKSLLAESGWVDTNNDGFVDKDGQNLQFSFMARSTGSSVTVAQEMQLELKEIGIDMQIETLDWNYRYEKITTDDYDAGIQGLSWGEPFLILNYAHYDPDNLVGDELAEYQALVDDAVHEIDEELRAEKVGIAEDYLMKDLSILPIYSDVGYTAYRSDLKGLIITPVANFYFNDVE